MLNYNSGLHTSLKIPPASYLCVCLLLNSLFFPYFQVKITEAGKSGDPISVMNIYHESSLNGIIKFNRKLLLIVLYSLGINGNTMLSKIPSKHKKLSFNLTIKNLVD